VQYSCEPKIVFIILLKLFQPRNLNYYVCLGSISAEKVRGFSLGAGIKIKNLNLHINLLSIFMGVGGIFRKIFRGGGRALKRLAVVLCEEFMSQ